MRKAGFAALSLSAGAAVAPRIAESAAARAEALGLRQRLCDAENQLNAMFSQIEAAGLSFAGTEYPMPAPQFDAIMAQAKQVAIDLADDLQGVPQDLLEKLIHPDFRSWASMAREDGIALAPTVVDVQANLFAPTTYISTQTQGCLLDVLLDTLWMGLLGLTASELAELRAAPQLLGGIVDMLTKPLEELTKAVTSGKWGGVKDALKKLFRVFGELAETLAKKADDKVVVKLLRKVLGKFLARFAGFLGILLLLYEFAKAVKENFDKFKEHI